MPLPRPRIPTALLLLAALGACEGPDAIATAEAIRDTLPNGAERVRYGPLPLKAPDPLSPELSIGVLEGESHLIFGDVRGIEVGADGAIYVLDFQAAELRVFEPDGSFRGFVARKGQGPGEIMQANGVVRAPDGSLWVQDHGQWQLLRLRPEGGEIERMPMFVRQFGYVWNGAVDGRGRIWTPSVRRLTPLQGPPQAGVSEGGRSEHHLVVHDPATGVEDSIHVGTQVTRSYVVPLEEGWAFRQIPFQASLLYAVDPAGAVWSAMSDAYRIARLDAEGDTTLVIEVDQPAPPVTADDHRAFVDAARQRGSDEESFAREITRAMPERKPVVSQLVVADEGRLWVRRFGESDDEHPHFDVFDPSGDYLGSIRLGFRAPSHFPPRIRDGRLYTLAVDSHDVPRVVRVETGLGPP